MIQVNWVLIIGGLIPFWTAISIILMNRRVSSNRPTRRTKSIPDVDDEYSDYSDYTDSSDEYTEKPKGLISKLSILGNLNMNPLKRLRNKLPGATPNDFDMPPEDVPDSYEQDSIMENPQQPNVGMVAAALAGVDLSSERKLWGISLLTLTFAGFFNGLYALLDYVFTEYRTAIGTGLPMAGTLKLFSNFTMVAFGLCFLFSTLRTGLRLLKE
ncbi:MAG: hypothetical protein NWE89_08435 [Candidatus Bathyarchaeota archaeon]|nr:hypothetical protein [Candidatus Bathyarchaeota archaeon]